eukprot:247085_1
MQQLPILDELAKLGTNHVHHGHPNIDAIMNYHRNSRCSFVESNHMRHSMEKGTELQEKYKSMCKQMSHQTSKLKQLEAVCNAFKWKIQSIAQSKDETMPYKAKYNRMCKHMIRANQGHKKQIGDLSMTNATLKTQNESFKEEVRQLKENVQRLTEERDSNDLLHTKKHITAINDINELKQRNSELEQNVDELIEAVSRKQSSLLDALHAVDSMATRKDNKRQKYDDTKHILQLG